MLEVQAKTSRHTYHDLENRKEEEVMTLTEKQKQIARKLVTSFGAVSDCEMSLADIHWLTRNIEHALREALELAEKEKKDDDNWHCEKCGEVVEPRNVTFEETHMNCGGRCV